MNTPIEQSRTTTAIANTCDTCKWWDITSTRNPLGSTSFPVGVCGVITDGETALLPNEEIAMIEIDDTGANLITGPKFGCIHHESKA